jgi:methyl-accepting chemotaxis protein
MTESRTRSGLSLTFQVLLAAGLVTVGIIVAAFLGSYISAKDQLVAGEVEQVDGYAESLKSALAAQLSLLERANEASLSVASSQIENGRLMPSSTNMVEVGNFNLPVIYLYLSGGGLTQLTGDNSLVDTWSKQFGGQFTVFQLHQEGETRHLVRVSTTITDASRNRIVGTALEKESPAYKALLEGEGHYGGIVDIGGMPHFGAYKLIKTDEASIVVSSNVSLAPLIDYIKNTKFGEESSSFIFDEDGTVIGHPTLESGSSLPSVMPAFWEAFQKEKANLTGGSIVNLFYGSGKGRAMAAVFPVKGLNSYVALSLPESQIVAPLLSMRTKMMLWGLPSLVIGLALVAFFVSRLLKPLKGLVEIASRIAAGDLTVSVKGDMESRNEIKAVLGAFEKIADSFKGLVSKCKELDDALEERSQAMEQISSQVGEAMEASLRAAKEIVSMVASISSAAEETNAGVEEVSSGAQNTAQITTSLSENASAVTQSVIDGGKAVEETVNIINRVGEAGRRIREAVKALESSVSGISEFVTTIAGIADQTNLLALNAAIEAARAGEAGRGFAVVADEVRKLAEQSNQAASRVSQVISEISERTRAAAVDTEETVREIENAVAASQATNAQIQNIMEQVKKISDGIQSIAAVAEEQSAGSEEMAASMDNIVRMVGQGQEAAEAVERSAKEVASQLEELERIREAQLRVLRELDKALASYRIVAQEQRGLVPKD